MFSMQHKFDLEVGTSSTVKGVRDRLFVVHINLISMFLLSSWSFNEIGSNPDTQFTVLWFIEPF